MVNNNPSNYADIRLVLGEQGSGKSGTIVALAKDDFYRQLIGIKSPSGEVIKARYLDNADKLTLKRQGIFPSVFRYVRAFSDDGRQSKIIKIPKDYEVVSPVRIFFNMHLYGIKYAYITLADIIQYLNDEKVFTNAWILSDESVMTDARNSMSNAGIIIATLAATIRKRNVHFCQTSQVSGMIEKRFRIFATTTIICNYDEKTKMVTCDIKERGKPPRSVSYWLPLYYHNFNTNELPHVPEAKLARALQSIS